MVLDAACLAHAGGGDDDLWLGVEVDGFGLVAGHGQMEIPEPDGIDAGIDQRHGFFIKARPEILAEDGGCFNGQRTVHIDREIDPHQIPLLDFADKVEQFLSAPHGESRYDQITAAA